MASDMKGAMRIAGCNASFFSDAAAGDLVIQTNTADQRILLGNQMGSNAMLNLTSNAANVAGQVNAPGISANIMQTTDIYLTTYDPRVSNTLSVIAPRVEADTFTTALAAYASNTAVYACNAAVTSGAGAFASNLAVTTSNAAFPAATTATFACNAATATSNWARLMGGSNLRLAHPATLTGETTVQGGVVPDADSVYDLGSSDKRFRSLYVSGNTIYVGGTSLSTDSATGTLSFSNTASSNPVRLIIDEVQVGGGAEGCNSVILRPDATTGGIAFVPATVVNGGLVEQPGAAAAFDSNLPVQCAFACNVAVGASNLAFPTATQASFASNTAIAASNSAYLASNTATAASNTAYPASNTAYSASSTATAASNTAYPASNTAYSASSTATAASNTAYLASNTAYLASNTAYLASNTAYPASNTAYAASNKAVAACNTAVAASNTAYAALPRSGGTISGALTVGGDLTVSGTTTTLNTQTVTIADNMIQVNSTQTGAPASTLRGGIEVNRGSESNYYFVFEEASDLFKVGTSNQLQAVLTRTDILQSGYPYFDSAAQQCVTRAVTTADVTGLDGSLVFSSNAGAFGSNLVPAVTFASNTAVSGSNVAHAALPRAGGQMAGAVYMAMQPLRLALTGDSNHGLQLSNQDWNYSNMRSGPVLHGWNGGALGTTSNSRRLALSWNSEAGVAVTSNLTVGSNLIVGGYTGMGLANPTAPLHVSGSNVNGVSILATHDIAAYSDARLKTDLSVITNALQRIHNISGYTFLRAQAPAAAAPTGPRQAGVIAQEVQAVLPEVVHEGIDGLLSVSYGNLTALLIEAIKELNAKVDALAGSRT